MRIDDHELIAPAFETPQGRWGDHRSPVVSIVKSGAPISEGTRLWLNPQEWGYVLDDTAEGFGTAPVALQTADLASGGAVFRHARFQSSDMFLPIQLHSPVPSALPSMLDRLIEIMQPASGGFFDVVVFDPYGQETRTRSVIYESGLENVIRRSQHWWTVGITARFVDPFWYGQVRELRRTLGSVDKKFITAKQGPPDPDSPPSVTYEWEGEPHESQSVKKVDGVEVSKNLLVNPSFETGTTEGWSISGGRGSPGDFWSPVMWGGVDGNLLLVTHQGTGRFTTVYQTVDIQGGDWVSLASLIATDHNNTEFQVEFYWRNDEGHISADTSGWRSDLGWNSGGRPSLTAQAPSSATQVQVRFALRSPEGVTGRRMWIDQAIVVSADSEQAALDQVATYFDGDTPNVPSAQIGGYEFPFFPVRIGGSVVQGEYELQVEGDAPAYWSGVITPPGEDLLIQNAQGERIFVQGRVDEPILIQTRPQEQDITLADGTPIWDRIDPGDDDFFPLHPGRNTVHVSMVGATQQSEILIRYREAFFHSLGGGR